MCLQYSYIYIICIDVYIVQMYTLYRCIQTFITVKDQGQS